jgi:hypothetical protein
VDLGVLPQVDGGEMEAERAHGLRSSPQAAVGEERAAGPRRLASMVSRSARSRDARIGLALPTDARCWIFSCSACAVAASRA